MIDTKSFKEKLELQLSTIVKDLESIGTYDSQSDNWEAIPDTEENGSDPDSNTSADITEEWDERRATLNELEKEYRAIKYALQKIEEGAYGICEICGEQIEEKRLSAKPDARTCIAHMDEEDKLSL